MAEYKPEEFINAINKKMLNNKMRACPFCGGEKFTTTGDVAAIVVGKDTNVFELGPIISSGMIICEKCGHIDFFALSALGLAKEGDPIDERSNN